MKQNELADVLIKVLGLSVCLDAIPTCAYGVSVVLACMAGDKNTSAGFSPVLIMMSVLSGVVQAAVGFWIISKSRKIADYWFKPEGE